MHYKGATCCSKPPCHAQNWADDAGCSGRRPADAQAAGVCGGGANPRRPSRSPGGLSTNWCRIGSWKRTFWSSPAFASSAGRGARGDGRRCRPGRHQLRRIGRVSLAQNWFLIEMGTRAEIIGRLRETLTRLADDPASIEPSPDPPRTACSQQFTWAAKATQTLEIYHWVLGRRRSGLSSPCRRPIKELPRRPGHGVRAHGASEHWPIILGRTSASSREMTFGVAGVRGGVLSAAREMPAMS